jgi:hypothetical protein
VEEISKRPDFAITSMVSNLYIDQFKDKRFL